MTSEIQYCMFAIQLDESTFGSSNIFMAYVTVHGLFQNDTVDVILFDNYLETDTNGEIVFSCLEEYLNKHSVPIWNITAVATEW